MYKNYFKKIKNLRNKKDAFFASVLKLSRNSHG